MPSSLMIGCIGFAETTAIKVCERVFTSVLGKGNVKVNHAPQERRDAQLTLLGQGDTRPLATFPAARLAGTKLYCLVTEAHVC